MVFNDLPAGNYIYRATATTANGDKTSAKSLVDQAFTIDTPAPQYAAPYISVSPHAMSLDLCCTKSGTISVTYTGDTANGYFLSCGSGIVNCEWKNGNLVVTAVGAATENVTVSIIENGTDRLLDIETCTVTVTDSLPAYAAGLGHFGIKQSYDGRFSDVPDGQWYSDTIARVFELGLMKSSSAAAFNRTGAVTVAEAITMAACIHCIFYTGTENFVQTGGKWYDVYVSYARANGIAGDFYPDGVLEDKIARADFAYLLSKAMPEDALLGINNIPDGAIPDVSQSYWCSGEIYELYRAGVLTGSDPAGDFEPYSSVGRAEAAAIVARMADAGLRKTFSL